MNQKFNPQTAAPDCVITCQTCGAAAPLSDDRTAFTCQDCGHAVPADQVDDKLVDRYCICGNRIWHRDCFPWQTPVCGECVWEYPELFENW
jgi:predicted RNA-binding Zn-ribbon protein involved in translation (DUF1610 family)